MQTAKSCSHFDKANTHLDKDSNRELCARGREPFALFPLCTLLIPRAYAALRPCLTRSSLLACFAPLNACLPILLTQHCHLSLSLLQFSPIGIPAYFTQHSNLPLLALHPILTGTPIYFNLLCYLFLPILRLKRSYTN